MQILVVLPNCTNTKWTTENITTKEIRTSLIRDDLITQDLEHVRIKFNFSEAFGSRKGPSMSQSMVKIPHFINIPLMYLSYLGIIFLKKADMQSVPQNPFTKILKKISNIPNQLNTLDVNIRVTKMNLS